MASSQPNHKQIRKLKRAVSAMADMHACIRAATLFAAEPDLEKRDHLFSSMVISYGRPFTENDGLGNIMCDYPDYPKFGDEHMTTRHGRMLTMRHEFLAHSAAYGSKIIIIPPGSQHPATGQILNEFAVAHARRTFTDPRFVEWIKEVAEQFHSQLKHDIAAQLAEMYGAKGPYSGPFEIPTGWEGFLWDDMKP